jgi:hypothetical protein
VLISHLSMQIFPQKLEHQKILRSKLRAESNQRKIATNITDKVNVLVDQVQVASLDRAQIRTEVK